MHLPAKTKASARPGVCRQGQSGSEQLAVAEALWMDSLDLAYQSLMQPFVQGISSGTLPRSSFQHFIGQDAAFLMAFATGYRQAITRCNPSQDHVRAGLERLLAGVESELQLHTGLAARWDLRLEHTTPVPATQAYIALLTRVCSSPAASMADCLSVMIPCLRLYAWLAQQLQPSVAAPDSNPYQEWMDTYLSRDYQALVPLAESILNEVHAPHTYERLLRQYRKAMEMERDFFAAQPGLATPRPLGLLVIDFDETITEADTTAKIAHAVIAANVAKTTDSEDAKTLEEDLTSRLKWLAENYRTRRTTLLEDALPDNGSASPPDFEMGRLGDFIDRLADFDREMNTVVIESGILKGARREHLAQAGSTVELRPGSLTVMRKALDAGVAVAVVSVSWSAEFVRAALAQEGLPVVIGDVDGQGGMARHAVTVHANELEFFGEETTGNIRRRCECGTDKGRLLDDLLLGLAADAGGEEPGDVLYIGDSITDIPPLISANAGILVGENPLVRRVAHASGLRLLPLGGDAREPGSGQPGPPIDAGVSSSTSPALYEAASWAAIDAYVFGSGRYVAAARAASPPPVPMLAAPLAAQQGSVPRLLVVAGTDSCAGAGVLADVKTAMALGVHASAAVTAVTAQNSHGVAGVFELAQGALAAQMEAVLSDLGADVVKTGMLPSVDAVETVGAALRNNPAPLALVVDPVMVSTSGDALAGPGVAAAMRDQLLPLATVITPNIPEAEALLGDGRTIRDLAGMRAAAVDLHALGPAYVLIKGGHLAALAAGGTGKNPPPQASSGVAGAPLGEGAGTTPSTPRGGASPRAAMHTEVLGSEGLDGEDVDAVSRSDSSGAGGTGVTAGMPQLRRLSSMLRGQVSASIPDSAPVSTAPKPSAAPTTAAEEDAARRASQASGSRLPPRPSDYASVVTDVLYDGRTLLELSEPRMSSDNVHGTGCCLSTAVAAGLARGEAVLPAVRAAKRYLWRTMERSRNLPLGTGPQRVMNFGWATEDWAADLARAQAARALKVDRAAAAAAAGDGAPGAPGSGPFSDATSAMLAGLPHIPFRVPNAVDLRLYVVTDPGLCGAAGRGLVDSVRLAIDGGATMVQLRDKRADAASFITAALPVVEHCRGRGVPCLINDRLDVALAVGADGVHLGQEDMPADVARRLLGPDKILGVSVKTPEEAVKAERDGADYVGAGAFAFTATKANNKEIGPAGIAAVVAATGIPTVAIGGINAGNAAPALATGAAGVAVVSAVFAAADVTEAAKSLRATIDAQLG